MFCGGRFGDSDPSGFQGSFRLPLGGLQGPGTEGPGLRWRSRGGYNRAAPKPRLGFAAFVGRALLNVPLNVVPGVAGMAGPASWVPFAPAEIFSRSLGSPHSLQREARLLSSCLSKNSPGFKCFHSTYRPRLVDSGSLGAAIKIAPNSSTALV